MEVFPTGARASAPRRAAQSPVELGPQHLNRLDSWTVRGHNDLRPGQFVRVAPFTVEGYRATGGVATAYRGVDIFLEGNRSPSMQSALDAARAHIDHALPQARGQLGNLYMVKGANPDDRFWAKAYREPGFISLANSGDGLSVFWSGRHGAQVDFDHELGHVMTRTGDPPAPKQWDAAMESDRRNVARYLTRGKITPATSHFPMLSGANDDGLTTYAKQAYDAGSVAEDWAESAGWYNRSKRTGWVARIGTGKPGATERKLTFEQLFPARTKLLERYLDELDRTGRRR